MSITRTHFNKLASIIKTTEEQHAKTSREVILLGCVAESIADICEQDNINFNRDKFLQACGITD